MPEVFLDCNHPAVVTHTTGERLISCAVPTCRGINVVAAHPDVRYVVQPPTLGVQIKLGIAPADEAVPA